MKLKLHTALMAVILLLTKHFSHSQAPDLGAASDFAVFTAAGAFNVAGASTLVTGDVGTNVGAFTGFPPGVLVGQIHVADAVSAAAATDVALAYGSLSTVTCGQVISVTMGNGQVLLPDVYCTGAASTINGDLILDAQGDPDAIFIFKIGGALATTVDSRIILVNGASLCNVYWQVNGQVDLGENSIFQGVMLVNGAINLLDGAELIGQALSQAGAISLQNNLVTIGVPAIASTITANSATSFCEGESVTLTGNVGGIWNTGAETSEIEVSTSGDFFVTNTTNCGSEVSNIISVTVNPLPVCEITGGSTTCPGEPTQLCAPDGLASYLWSTGETTQCISVNTTGSFSVTITDGNGCSSSCSHDVTFVCDPVITPVDPIVLPTCNAELPVLTAEWTDCGTSGSLVGVASLQSVNGCVETYLYTFSGTDACGEAFGTTTTVTRTVDVSTPIITDLPDFLLDGCNQPWPATLTTTWSDNCSAGGEVVGVAGAVTTVGCLESRIYTFIVTDDCGNTTSTTTVVTRVVDESAPIIVPVADFQVPGCDQPWPEVVSTTWSDNCSEGGIVIGDPGLVTIDGCGEERIYTFSVTDECGNTAESSVTVTRVFDETAPIIINPADYVLPGCNPDWPLEVLATWTDNCSEGGTLVGIPGEIITDGCSQSRSYTFSVMDECGNEATAVTIVTRIFDEANPVIVPIADFQLEGCNAEWPVLVSLWTSNCAGGGNVTGVPGEVSIIGCLESREYTFTVNDDCGVSAIATTTVTRVVDETAPIIVPVADFQIPGCDQPWPEVVSTTWSDNCSEGGIVIGDAGLVTIDGCGEERIYTFSVTDECGNTAESSVTVTRIFDETAPIIINPADYVLPGCNPDWPSEVLATWTDNCSEGGTLVGIPGEIITDGCSQSRPYTFSVMDECGNEATAVTIVTRQFEETAPEIVAIADFQLELCNTPWPPFLTTTWFDDCGSGGIVEGFPGEISTDECLQTRPYAFNVTSECGNSAQAVVWVSRIFDETGPVFGPIEPFTVQCDEFDAIPTPSVSDNCTLVELTFTDEAVSEICNYSFVRTWIATDDCFNTTTAEQIINVVDTVGPVFDNIEAVITVACIEDIPVSTPTVYDECTGEILDYQVSIIDGGGNPEEICVLTTAFGPGSDWALWLPTHYNNGFSSTANFVFDADGGTFDQFEDGSAHLYGTVVNDINPTESYILDLWFENERDWTEWSALGRSYKDELSLAEAGGDLWTTWSYYELVNNVSTATGTGDLAGNMLYFQHMPASYLFGFQVGLAANNKNSNYGMSGWFSYTGVIDGAAVNGYGDVNVDADCVIQQLDECINQTTYTIQYIAFDDCFNSTVFTQLVIVNDTIAPEFVDFPEDITVSCDEWPIEVPEVVAVDNCEGEVILEYFTQTTEGICEGDFIVTHIWIATDLCGNTSSATWTVTVADTIPPVITACPVDGEYVCLADVPAADVALVTAFDDCNDVVITWEGDLTEGDECTGTILRTYRATDACGNYAECVQTITYDDNEAPVFVTLPTDITIDCTEDIPAPEDLVVTDNCSFFDLIIVTEEGGSGSNGDDCGQYRTQTPGGWGAPAAGNNPGVYRDANFDGAFPGGLSIGCESGFQLELTSAGAVEAFLPSGGTPAVLTQNWIDPAGNVNNTFAGHLVAATLSLTFDSYDPNFGDADGWLGDLLIASGDFAGMTVSEVIAIANDVIGGCSNAYSASALTGVLTTINENYVDGDTDNGDLDCTPSFLSECEYVIVRTYTAIDDCGNESSVVQTITVIDDTPPVIVCPEDMIVDCYENVPVADINLIEAFDNCTDVIVTWEGDEIVGDFCEGAVERTYRATDACGNYAECTQIITFSDTQAPVFAYQPQDLTLECGDDVPPMEEIPATDNCDPNPIVTMASSISISGDCPTIEVITRSWTATDACGNSTTISQTISIQDAGIPAISCPANLNVDCYSDVPVPNVQLVSASDDCSDVLVTWEGDEMAGDDCAGTITRTYRATDACGNYAECTQIISYSDDEAPELIMPQDSSFTADCSYFQGDDAQAYLNGEMTPADSAAFVAYVQSLFASQGLVPLGVIDNCDPDAYWEETSIDILVDVDCPLVYQINCNFQAFDNCGNVSEVETTYLFITDDQPPVIECPAPLSLVCPSDIPAPNTDLVVASDECSDAVVTWIDDLTQGDECTGTILRTYRATDACGNYAECVQVITYSDDEAPVFVNAPGNITADCSDVPDPMEVTAIDNCSEVTIVFNEILFSGGCPGVLHRIWTATDDCGNVAVHEQFINLTDTVAPTLHNLPVNAAYDCVEDVPAPAEVWATDNCDDAVDVMFEETTEAGDCPQAYTIYRTWTATDECMNTVSYTQTITIQDTTAPVFDMEDSQMTVDCDMAIELPEPVATDNCDSAVMVNVDIQTIDGDCANEWTEIYTWTATDACGNSSSVSFTVNFVDDNAPVFTETPLDLEVGCIEDVPAANTGLLTAVDNCGDVIITHQGDMAEGEGCAVAISRTYRATDECGNYNEYVQLISVTDTLAPTFDQSVENLTVECDAVPDAVTITASDNCDANVTVVFNEATEEGECEGSYTLIRTWTATDNCGNNNVLTQIVNVEDNTAPVFVNEPEDATYHCDDEIPEPEAPIAVDNCSSTITYTAEEFIVGYTGEDGLTQCELTTPLDVVGAEWALWLPNSIGEPQYYHLSPAGGQFVELPNGGAHLTGMVYAPSNPNKRWIIDVYFKDRADWEEWGIELGRGYKDDANVAGDNYLDWDYYILSSDSATLTGDGLYTGSELNLAHAPASYYFGFQVGLAANNRNAADGMSGWFFYNGTWMGNQGVSGIGDFAFERECIDCDYTITYIWTATDDCGNTATAMQVITVVEGPDEMENLDSVKPVKASVVLAVWPNPAAHRATITFEIPENSRAVLEVFNMDGKLIETLYQGEANAGQEYLFNFEAGNLANGIYLYKLTTDKSSYVDKLMITK